VGDLDTGTDASRSVALGIGAACLAAFGWGLAGVFASLTYAPGLVLTFYRTWLGAALLTGVVVASGRRVTWSLLWQSLPGGLLLCGDMTLFFSAIKLTSIAVATVIGALQPALVMLMAGPLLGDRIRRREVAWTGVAIAGVAVIAIGAGRLSHNETMGDLLAVGSLLCWSAYFIASKRAAAKVQALDYTAAVTIIAAFGSTIAMFAFGQSPSQVHLGDWTWIVLLAIVPSGAHVLMNWALGHLDVSVTSVIGSSNPVVAAAAAWIVLGQSLDGIQIAGGVIGMAAIIVVARLRGQAAESPVE
jgi:drug/metabolite transporter (DMT)-like permease